MLAKPVASSPRRLSVAPLRRSVLAGLPGESLRLRPLLPRPSSLSPVMRVDAICAEPRNDTLLHRDGNARLAQTFAAMTSGSLVSAELLIDRPSGSTGDYVLRLGTVDRHGIPTNDVLSSAAVADANVPDGIHAVTFTFDHPHFVIAGVRYALVLTRPGGSGLGWAGHAADISADQSFISPDQTAPFVVANRELELIFTTFIKF